ncbi:hypothetical protein [Paenibacillus aceris]|uniref:Uncharacterized protein n=1 Tax=Paenibacillus aceris TaxID=869555 RepID=A0ABS4HUI6_9BACL|nr:hypothetical protein [Paenibacillus aceris]MBP1962299.1 hypothetical protein [Paenibacillus aceris]NHW37123.1 hypothetical protein [Paenibacillus aceris]
MRKRWLVLLIGVGVLGIGGYAGYTYSINVIADKLSTQLLAEADTNQQLFEQIELPTLPQTPEETSLQDKSAAASPNTADKLSSQSPSSDSRSDLKGEEPSKEQASASDETTHNASTEKKSNKQSALSFSSKQEAVKFAMSRFSAAELNKLRQMASGGLTSEEKAELKKIAYSKFTDAEIAAVQKVVTTK